MAIGDKSNAVCMPNHWGAVESKESSEGDQMGFPGSASYKVLVYERVLQRTKTSKDKPGMLVLPTLS